MKENQRTELKIIAAKRRACMTDRQMSEITGIPYGTLVRKLNGKNDFTLSEINACRKEFHLSSSETISIFFE